MSRSSIVFLVVALAAVGCDCPEPAPPPTAATLDLAAARLVDLSHPFDAETIYWPTSPSGFELETLSHGVTPGGWFYEANRIRTPEHGGTHLDAPVHFFETGWSTDQIPIDRLVGPAAVIDITAKAAADPDAVLEPADVEAWEARNGRIVAGTIVVLRTGWSERWPDKRRYLGDDTPGDASNLHFPSYGADAARLLISERAVAVLGVDTASIDPGASRDFPVHRLAGEANVPGLENLANLGALPEKGAWVIALPMKIGAGSGGPLRAIAALPE